MERLIHWVWIGGALPPQYEGYIEQWLTLNPDWEGIVWYEDMIREEDWMMQRVIDHLYERDAGRGSIELAVQLADVIDYEILFKYGGVYLNVDIEPLVSLAEMDALYGTDHVAWVASEDHDFVVNAAMGAPEPGHPFFAHVLARLEPRYFANPTDEMNQTTGPRLLTECIDQWTDTPVAVLPPVAFNSVHWSAIPKGGDATGSEPPPGAIGLHHWGHKKDGRTNRIETPTWRQ